MTVPHLLIPAGKTWALGSRGMLRTRGVKVGLLVGPFTRTPCHVELTLTSATMVPLSLRATRALVPLTWTIPPLAHRTKPISPAEIRSPKPTIVLKSSIPRGWRNTGFPLEAVMFVFVEKNLNVQAAWVCACAASGNRNETRANNGARNIKRIKLPSYGPPVRCLLTRCRFAACEVGGGRSVSQLFGIRRLDSLPRP